MTARSVLASVLALLMLASGCGARPLPDDMADRAAPAFAATVRGPTLVAAGDIACPPDESRTATTCHHADTAGIVARLDPDVVAPLGDLQYPAGSLGDLRASYGPTWGRFQRRTRPAVGNHEYGTPGAAGYFAYFGRRAGRPSRAWYSYELGGWHVVVLNTNCAIVGCDAGSPQQRWLRADLARHPRRCTLAYGHHPRFSSGAHGPEEAIAPLFRTLWRGGVELYLAGHDHHYERFAPQTAGGRPDRDGGVVQFVVGTGGKSHYPAPFAQPNSRARAVTFGVLELTLGRRGYAWRFAGEVGDDVRDAGRRRCR